MNRNTRLIAATGLIAAMAFSQTACQRAYANKQTLWTDTCGVKWEEITAGKTVPVGVSKCSYKITVPAAPMQGELKFRTKFKNNVLSYVEGSYDYTIVSGLRYVSEAKYLGKVDSDGNDATNESRAYETAENIVIDKRIQEIVRNVALNLDISSMEQTEFEGVVLAEVNKMLENKGVRINFLSLVPVPDDQTRLAIDTVAAFRVYDAAGLGDLGRDVIKAKAGAANYNTTVNTPAAPVEK